MNKLATRCHHWLWAIALGLAAPAVWAQSADTSLPSTTTNTPGDRGTAMVNPEPLNIFEIEGYGCLGAGGAATVATALAGADELILVFGATISPTTPVGIAVALTGTIFASYCAIGALATPALIHMWNHLYPTQIQLVARP